MALTWQATLFGADAPGIDPTFAGIQRVQLDDTAWVDVLPGWLRGPDEVMDELLRTAPWRSGERPMYDRIVAIPRLTAWWSLGPSGRLSGEHGPSGRLSGEHGPSGRLSGEHGTTPGAEPPFMLEQMRAALSARYCVTFSSCGCNLYRDGNDSVAWHGDRISKAIADPNVAIVSVGEPRKLLLRPLDARPERRSRSSTRFDLGHGDLLVMGGSSQRTWQHSIPKVAAAGPRMSITFRHGMRGDPDG